MSADFQYAVEKSITRLLQGPAYPEKKFTSSGTTFGEVYAMAAELYTTLAIPEYQDIPICLAADNREIGRASCRERV